MSTLPTKQDGPCAFVMATNTFLEQRITLANIEHLVARGGMPMDFYEELANRLATLSQAWETLDLTEYERATLLLSKDLLLHEIERLKAAP